MKIATALVSAFLLTASPALSDCVTLWDMTHMPGAVFRTQQGSVEVGRWGTGNSMREAKAVYQTPQGKTDFWRLFRDGVFEVEEYSGFENAATGARMNVTLKRRFAGRLPDIVSGKSFASSATQKTEIHNTLTGEKTKGTEKVKVSYNFLPSRQVELSGCKYETIPVEATFAGETTRLTRRYIYFPALEAAIMTREQDHVTGTETKNGITGLKTVVSDN